MRITILFAYEQNLISILAPEFQNVSIPYSSYEFPYIEQYFLWTLYIVSSEPFLIVSRAVCAGTYTFNVIVCHCQFCYTTHSYECSEEAF